jgi:hypothetical protein
MSSWLKLLPICIGHAQIATNELHMFASDVDYAILATGSSKDNSRSHLNKNGL